MVSSNMTTRATFLLYLAHIFVPKRNRISKDPLFIILIMLLLCGFQLRWISTFPSHRITRITYTIIIFHFNSMFFKQIRILCNFPCCFSIALQIFLNWWIKNLLHKRSRRSSCEWVCFFLRWARSAHTRCIIWLIKEPDN